MKDEQQIDQDIREACIKANPSIENRHDYMVERLIWELSNTPITEDWYNQSSDNIKDVFKNIAWGSS